MKDRALFISTVCALVVGLAQTFLALRCWNYIEMYSPVVRWLFGMGLRTAGIHAVAHPLDLLTNILINIPAAWVLSRLRPERIRLYVILAVIPSFVWLNWNLVGVPFPMPSVGEMAWGWLQELISLPIAVWLVGRIRRTGATGGSKASVGAPSTYLK
jgi:hypothetical protein